jgi:hypothetical protein
MLESFNKQRISNPKGNLLHQAVAVETLFEKKVLRGIFGTMREEVTVIKSRMRWAGHTACMG